MPIDGRRRGDQGGGAVCKDGLHEVKKHLALSAAAKDGAAIRCSSCADWPVIDDIFHRSYSHVCLPSVTVTEPVGSCASEDCSTCVRLLPGKADQISRFTTPLNAGPAMVKSKMPCSVFAVLIFCPTFANNCCPGPAVGEGEGVGVAFCVCVVAVPPQAATRSKVNNRPIMRPVRR